MRKVSSGIYFVFKFKDIIYLECVFEFKMKIEKVVVLIVVEKVVGWLFRDK